MTDELLPEIEKKVRERAESIRLDLDIPASEALDARERIEREIIALVRPLLEENERLKGNIYETGPYQHVGEQNEQLVEENERLKNQVHVWLGEHGTRRVPCVCPGCLATVPTCWETPMCFSCSHEDCEHGS